MLKTAVPNRTLRRLLIVLIGLTLLVAAVDVALLASGRTLFKFAGLRYGPALTAQQAEQQALSYVQTHYAGAVTQTTTQQLTLQQLNGRPTCTGAETLFRQVPVILGTDTYNPCDPNTLVWAVNFEGRFNFGAGHTGNFAEVVYTAAGDFIRSSGGTR